MTTETKSCQNCKSDFVIEPEDFQFYEKISVPPPTWCPECRLIRRLVWRNERSLYRRKCDAPGHEEMLISYYAEEKPYTIYDQKFWWSDAWDATEYGQEYDFSRPFFAQLGELFKRVPRSSLSTGYQTMKNSEYSNWAGDCKNCYLVTDADFVEDSAYCSTVFETKDSFDCNNVSESELCYDSYNLRNCYRTFYSVDCHECSDVLFSKGLVGCTNCFGCTNLRKKSYHIFNKPYSKEEYEKQIKELLNGSWDAVQLMKSRAEEDWLKQPHKHFRGTHNVNSFGDYIYNSKNTKHGFLVTDVEDSKYVALTHSKPTKDCFDYTDWGDNAFRVYDSMSCGLGVTDLKFCNLVVIESRDVTYSYFCRNSANIFGCSGIRNKQYCILNKQYSKEEYEKMLPKIMMHMDEMPYTDSKGRVYKYGEFFPADLTGFAYNETFAQEVFPLSKDVAIERGYSWKDPDPREYEITVKKEDIPVKISDIREDDILEEIIECDHKGKCNHNCPSAFRLILSELQFYRQMDISIPRLCPNCRHYERLKYRNPIKLWHRQCMCDYEVYKNDSKHSHHETGRCPNEFETSYAPDRKEIVYCEPCYQAEVI